ncbi:MAG: FCD domain-containing protein [Acidobacteriales bacterium]|nr:FCD domain-containing protein [Terriglobales bacterium]
MHTASANFERLNPSENLHSKVTRALALRVIEGERASTPVVFPNEAGLCEQIGVSRSILREAVKVLVDKGMLEVKPRSGTRSRPRAEWNLLDPDILAWQSELEPDPRFLRDLCEVRLAIEPTAAAFAALRATPEEIEDIRVCLERREAHLRSSEVELAVDLDLQFQGAVIAASHNPLFHQLNAVIRQPFRTALGYTSRLPAAAALEVQGCRAIFEGIVGRNPLAARTASEETVGLAMIAVEQIIRSLEKSS